MSDDDLRHHRMMSTPHYELVWNSERCSGMFICRYEQDVDELIAALAATKALLPARPAEPKETAHDDA